MQTSGRQAGELVVSDCPVCANAVRQFSQREVGDHIECPRCGPYVLTGTARAVLPSMTNDDRRIRATLSHVIRQMAERSAWPVLSSDLLRDIIANTRPPNAEQQLRNLVTWLGKSQSDEGAEVHFSEETIAAVGAVDVAGVAFIASQAHHAGLVSVDIKARQGIGARPVHIISPMQLTIAGWRLLGELRRGAVSNRIAFMAMPFGIADLDGIYREHFCAAVAATGFQLKRLDEGQPAGLIDDRLRVEIRQSRFLISDLTHRNPGAYWEAGFAEGLGKPVIYTCRKDVFDDKTMAPHFDTNHHLTVVWDPGRMGEAVARLKATIRATLPGEAILMDQPSEDA